MARVDHLPHDPAAGWARAHYATGAELGRLARGPGALELVRTKEILQRHLPPAPARVADVGAGPGIYSVWLAGAGYDVVARDLAPRHVEELRSAAAALGVQVDAAVGDARELDLPDDSCDAVLLLGPLYHLIERESRVLALREAARVLRPGGIVVAAAISRWAVLVDGVLRGRLGEGLPAFAGVLDEALATGVLAPLVDGGFSAYCHRPEELRAEMADAGLATLELLAVEGPGAVLPDLEQRWTDDAAREAVLDVARRLEGVPEITGFGPHLLAVGRT